MNYKVGETYLSLTNVPVKLLCIDEDNETLVLKVLSTGNTVSVPISYELSEYNIKKINKVSRMLMERKRGE